MKANNHFFIYLDTFRRDVCIVWGDRDATFDALRKCYRKDTAAEIIESIDFDAGGNTCYSRELKILVIWLPKAPETLDDFSILVHEIFHAVMDVMRDLGASMSEDSEEFCAYMMEYITFEAMKGFSITVHRDKQVRKRHKVSKDEIKTTEKTEKGSGR